MADNVQLNAPTVPGGQIIATDDVGGAQYQYVKLVFGKDGEIFLVSSDNPIPVLASISELPLPNGAATSDLQNTQISYLDLIQVTQASESTLLNVLAALGGILNVSVSSSVLPTNAAQETGGNLASIKTNTDKIPAQGQAAMAASMPVVIASNQTTVPVSIASPTTPYNAKVTVTTAGTRVQLNASRAVQSVTIKAGLTNTGIIYVGDSTVASSNGLELAAGDSVSMDISNLNVLYIDASVNNQYVTYIAVN